MEFLKSILQSTEIITTIITTIVTTVITSSFSAVVSWKVAKYKANAEIKNLLASYKREDEVQMRAIFPKLVRVVNEYKNFYYDYQKTNIYECIAEFRTLLPAVFHKTLDELSEAVDKKDVSAINNCIQKLNEIFLLHNEQSTNKKARHKSCKKQKNMK